MTGKSKPLSLLRVKTPINNVDFEGKERESFPMLRRQTDSRIFSTKTAAEDIITKKAVDQLKTDVEKKEASLKRTFEKLKNEHNSYVAEMEVSSLMKERRIEELGMEIKELYNQIANKEQTIVFQKEIISRKDEKIDEQTKEFTKTIGRAVHDLKGPLTGVRSSIDALGEYSFTGEVRTLLGIAAQGSEDLVNMVEDILLTNKLVHNAIILDKKDFSLTEQIKDLILQNSEHAKTKGREISFECTRNMDIHADPLKMKRAIGNLISNALKYGRKSVRIKLAETEKEIILNIADDGNGFDEEIRKKVFSDREMTTSDLINGNGFGLTNAKKLIELHGGKISLEEGKVAGTTFVISFPKE